MRSRIWFVGLLFLGGLFLRFYPIPHDLFFGPEQGKDALVVRQIVESGKHTLIGAKTDVEGIFHGPLFYYFLTIPYLISHGDPVAAAFFAILVNSLSIIAIYLIGKELFSERVGMIAALLLTFSPRSIEYSRWLSAQPLSVVFILLFFLFLWRLVKGKERYVFGMVLLSGILIQLQLLHAYFLPPLVIAAVMWSKAKISRKNILVASIVFLLTLANFVFFELRHQFLMTQTIGAVLRGEKGFSAPITTSLRETVRLFGKEVGLYLSPGNGWFSLLFFFGALGFVTSKMRGKKFSSYHLLFLALVIPLLILALSRHSVLSHYFIFVSPFLFLVIALFLDRLWQLSRILGTVVIVILVLTNLLSLSRLTPWGITIANEKKIIDFVYRDASGKPFRYEAFTFPYFWKDAWKYMFSWYGKPKYGYVPVENGVERVYFLWEEEDSPNQRYWFNEHVSVYGDVVVGTKVDHVHAERREKKP